MKAFRSLHLKSIYGRSLPFPADGSDIVDDFDDGSSSGGGDVNADVSRTWRPAGQGLFKGVATMLRAMPQLTDLRLSEVTFASMLLQPDVDVPGRSLLLPSVKTLTLHLAEHNDVTPIIRMCPNLTTLRLNMNSVDYGVLSRHYEVISDAYAAAAGLPKLRTLEVFKFGHVSHCVMEGPQLYTQGWEASDIESKYHVI